VEIPDAGRRSLAETAGIAAVQLSFAGLFYLAGHPYYYFILWLAPLFTVLPTLNRLRTIAEHTPSTIAAPGARDIGACTRTTAGFRLTRALLAPLNFSYHFEHHLLPGVPFHQLPALHRLLVERGYFQGHEELLSPGFYPGLRELCRNHAKAAVTPD
jgi:fatty acid desaturase